MYMLFILLHSFFFFFFFFCGADFGVHGDPKDLLSRYHATMATSAAEGRSIWDNVMTRHGREAQYWLDFIDYVR